MSAPRCKPGDLAIIVGAPNTPSNLGKIVKVLRRATFDECDLAAAGLPLTWWVKSCGAPLDTYFVNGNRWPDSTKAHRDNLLMPIRPGAAPMAGATTRKRSKPRTKVVENQC